MGRDLQERPRGRHLVVAVAGAHAAEYSCKWSPGSTGAASVHFANRMVLSQASSMNVSLDFVKSLKKEKQLLLPGTAPLNASDAFPA